MDHTIDELSRLSQSDRRRSIFLKYVRKYRGIGFSIDANPRFVELVDQWIDGQLEMRDVAARLQDEGSGKVGHVLLRIGDPILAAAKDGACNGEVSEPTVMPDEVLGPRHRQGDLLRAIEELMNRTTISNG